MPCEGLNVGGICLLGRFYEGSLVKSALVPGPMPVIMAINADAVFLLETQSSLLIFSFRLTDIERISTTDDGRCVVLSLGEDVTIAIDVPKYAHEVCSFVRQVRPPRKQNQKRIDHHHHHH
jgi:hypothetical protein